MPPSYDPDRWGVEVRPIVAWHDPRWLFAVNPIFGVALGGSSGPSVEPALKVARTVGPVAVGLEYYADLGTVDAIVPIREEEHYLFEALDVLDLGSFELNAAVGEGLTSASAGLVVKIIVGFEWDSLTSDRHEHTSTDSLSVARSLRALRADAGHRLAEFAR